MSTLFTPITINGLQLKNRLVRSATHEGMADERGMPSQQLFNLYEKLARGGAGLIVTGYASVSPDGRSDAYRMLGIDTDDHIPSYRALTDHVHKHGAKIAMQIAHAGRQTAENVIGTRPIAPSPVMNISTHETPREMTEADINRIIDAFARAASRVRQSGFDALQLHAAHGYLLSSFLCPHTNRRKDRWGGSVKNRLRIIKEIYSRCRAEIGEGFPLLIKMNAYDTMRRGLKLEEGVATARMMAEMGFDGIEVSCGIADDGFSSVRGDFSPDIIIDDLGMLHDKPVQRFIFRTFGKLIVSPRPFTPNYNRDAARAIRQAVDVPVFCVGGVTDPSDMEEILSAGDADCISLCRPLILNPSWPNHIKNGSIDPSPCIRCNHCLFYALKAPLRCYYGKRIGDLVTP